MDALDVAATVSQESDDAAGTMLSDTLFVLPAPVVVFNISVDVTELARCCQWLSVLMSC